MNADGSYLIFLLTSHFDVIRWRVPRGCKTNMPALQMVRLRAVMCIRLIGSVGCDGTVVMVSCLASCFVHSTNWEDVSWDIVTTVMVTSLSQLF